MGKIILQAKNIDKSFSNGKAKLSVLKDFSLDVDVGQIINKTLNAIINPSHIPIPIVILFGSAISLGIQMKDTGAASWLAQNFLEFFQLFVTDMTIVSWCFSVVLCSVMTNLLSNAATVAVLGPIVLDLGVDPIIMGMATSVASAFAYLTIVASPTCMIIHSTGLVKSSDYFKAGWKLFIVSIVLLFLISFIYWPTLS